jgi:protein SCO1/2
MRRSVVLLAAALLLLAAIVAAGGWWLVQRPGPTLTGADGQATPQADIGGPFALVAHTGERVTDADFRGRWLLVFFGYTFCPDVCPTALGKVAVVMDELGPLADRVQPLFVSVDPERDTPEVLAEYVAQFHPSIVGLTGTPEEIAKVAKEYRAFYRKVVPEGADESDYLMDHSAYLYLMGPDGKFVRVFSHTQGPDEIAAAIRELVTAAGG